MHSNSPRAGKVLWLKVPPQRSVVAAHLRHVRGRFAAAGWRVVEGLGPPTQVNGPLAVMEDPWVEPLPAVADFLADADTAIDAWRVPRINGVASPQGWQPATGPYTAIDYERMAIGSSAPGRATPGRAERVDTLPWQGFAVATAEGAAGLLASGWPPKAESVRLIPDAYLYRYDDPAGHDRSELDRFIPETASVLVDVGCGHGKLGARHRRDGRIVIGIEPDFTLAREAARRLDLVLPLPAEEGLAALRPKVDCLIFADVLEHVADPAGALLKAAQTLSASGRIIASLPNTAWAPVLRALAAGRWDPTVAGVQARDHLAPMTPKSFRRMASECGLRVLEEIPMEAPLSWRMRLWAWFMARAAGGDFRDLLVPQWIAILGK